MRTSIIQLVSVTPAQLNRDYPQPTKQQRLILVTDGSIYWDYAGVRYSATIDKVNSDWDQTNTSSQAYIKNKPTIPSDISDLTDNQHKIPTSVDDLDDSQGLIGYKQQAVNLSNVTHSSGVYRLTLDASRLPSYIKAPSRNMHIIQGPSLQVSNVGQINMNLTRYLAYENATQPTAQWKLVYT